MIRFKNTESVRFSCTEPKIISGIKGVDHSVTCESPQKPLENQIKSIFPKSD